MAVRKIIQDSDDEDDEDHGNPPTSKIPHQQSANTVVDPENSSAAYNSVRDVEASTGSTGKRICIPLQIPQLTIEAEALTREILKAQNSLLDPTPSSRTSDANVTQPITTTQSPTISKLKRRQTTGGTPDSSKKRVLKTYGAKTSKDDFDFHGSSDEGGDIGARKRQKHEDVSVGQDSGIGMHEKEPYFLGNSASKDPLHETEDAGRKDTTSTDFDNDTIITAASRARESRAMSLSAVLDAHEVTLTAHAIDHGSRDTGAECSIGNNETSSSEIVSKKRRSRRRLTTHCSSSTAQQDASVVHPEVMSGEVPVSTLPDTALSDMGYLSRASPDVLSLAQDEPHIQSNRTSTSTEMLPPLVKHALAIQLNSDYSCPSTVPNTTPAEPSQPEATAANERSYLKPLSWSSSARMTSPTIAGNSTQEIEHTSEHSVSPNTERQPKLPEGAGNGQLTRNDTTFDSTSRLLPPAKGRSQPSVFPPTDPRTTQELVHEIEGELSKPSAIHEGRVTSPEPSKGKIKRKTQCNTPTDELGSDDIAVGLPKEQYQPRPSRSRANRADDGFLLAVDFSKRPEAVAKAKIKRRRTTGGHIPTHEDVSVENMSELDDDEPRALRKTRNERMKVTDDQDAPHGDAHIVDLLQHDTDGTEKHEEAQDTSIPTKKPEQETTTDTIDGTKGNDAEAAKQVDQTEEPKKKRGRPRKKTTEEPPSLPVPPNDPPPAAPAANAETPTKPTPAAKNPAKRRKTNDPTPITTTTAQTSDDQPISPSTSPHPAADDLHHSDHNTSASAPPDSPPRRAKPAAPLQTPQKAAPKGPDKHSPLHSGKVPYRVGLSKRARIEPLLRVVRK